MLIMNLQGPRYIDYMWFCISNQEAILQKGEVCIPFNNTCDVDPGFSKGGYI